MTATHASSGSTASSASPASCASSAPTGFGTPTATDAHERFAEHLREEGLKMTAQRQTILDTLLEQDEHVSAEELFGAVRERDPRVGQATVYRTLKLLTDAGVADAVDFGDGIARYEPGMGRTHHDHLICTRCGATEEILDEAIEAQQKRVAERHGYSLTSHTMHLYGLCPACRKGRRTADGNQS